MARKYQIHAIYVGDNAIKGVQRANPDVNWRHHIYQTKKAEGLDELNFAPEITRPLIEMGKEDAKKALDDMKTADAPASALATFLQ